MTPQPISNTVRTKADNSRRVSLPTISQAGISDGPRRVPLMDAFTISKPSGAKRRSVVEPAEQTATIPLAVQAVSGA